MLCGCSIYNWSIYRYFTESLSWLTTFQIARENVNVTNSTHLMSFYLYRALRSFSHGKVSRDRTKKSSIWQHRYISIYIYILSKEGTEVGLWVTAQTEMVALFCFSSIPLPLPWSKQAWCKQSSSLIFITAIASWLVSLILYLTPMKPSSEQSPGWFFSNIWCFLPLHALQGHPWLQSPRMAYHEGPTGSHLLRPLWPNFLLLPYSPSVLPPH